MEKKTPLSEMSAHLLALLAAINGKSKCPTVIRDLIEISEDFSQSLGWTPFPRRFMFCRVLVQCFASAARSLCHCFP